MSKTKSSSLILVILLFSMSIHAGFEPANGTPLAECDKKVHLIATDMSKWIAEKQGEGLNFKDYKGQRSYVLGMNRAFDSLSIFCSTREILIGQICQLNIDDLDGVSRHGPNLACSHAEVSSLSLKKVYSEIHYYLAMYAGIKNARELSDKIEDLVGDGDIPPPKLTNKREVNKYD